MPQVRAMVIVVTCLGHCQAVDCEYMPLGSVGVLGCDWEQQVSSLDSGELTRTLPDEDSGLYLNNANSIFFN